MFQTLYQISSKLKNENLLIVDDEVKILNIIKHILSHLNMNIYLAQNAEEALSILNKRKIRCIISDLNLPGRDGFALKEKVEKNFGHIPFIMLSGVLTPAIREKADRLNVDGIFDKPFDVGHLERVVKSLIKQKIKEKEPRKVTSSKSLKILIADDSEDNRNLMRLYFKETPHQIIFSNNGQEAINDYKENPDIDFIFMDIKMPVMDGLTASRHIRSYQKQKQLSRIPIIALTANVLENNKFDHQIFTDYLTKPIKKKTIMECIHSSENNAA